MRRLPGSAEYALSTAALALAAARALGGDPAPLAPALAASIAVAASAPALLAVTLTYASAALLAAAGGAWLPPALAVAAASGVLAVARSPGPRVASAALAAVAAAPLHAAVPASWPAAGAYAAGLAGVYAWASALAAGARVRVEPAALRGHVGSTVEARVECSCRGRLACRVLVDGVEEARLGCPGSAVLRLRVARAGLHRRLVEVYCSDPLGVASRRVASVEAAVRGVPAWRLRAVAALRRLRARPAPAPRLVAYRPAGGGEWGPAPARVAGVLYGAVRPAPRGGEYSGVREYRPGDNPRNIHWKKTASRRVLMVKTYEASGGGGEGYPVVVAVDLAASGPRELDEVVGRAYAALSALPGEGVLYVRLPRGGEYLASGPPASLEAALSAIITGEDVEPIGDYEPWPPGRLASPGAPGLPGLLHAWLHSWATALAARLAGLAGGQGGAYVAIHGSPGRARMAALAEALEAAGYTALAEEARLPPRGGEGQG